MAVAVFGVGTALAGQTTAGPVAVNLPASIVSGHYALVIVESANTNNHASATGWTEIFYQEQTAATGFTNLAILGRLCDGSEGTSVSVTVGTAPNHWSAQSIVISGSDGSPVVGTGNQGAAATSGSANAINVNANAGVLTVAGIALDASSTTTYSAWTNSTTGNPTEQIDQTVLTGNGGGFGAAFVVFTAGGSTGSTSWTQTSEAWNGVHIGFNEPVVTAPETRVFQARDPNVFFTPPRAKIVSIPFPPPPTVTGQASGIIRLRSTSTATVTTPPPPAATSLWVVRGGVFK